MSELGAAICAEYAAVSVDINRMEYRAVCVTAIQDKQTELLN
jgi:hypothetical protein